MDKIKTGEVMTHTSHEGFNCKISLRGSLANTYHTKIQNYGVAEGNAYLEELLSSEDPNLDRYTIGDQIIMGLRTDKGMFLTEW